MPKISIIVPVYKAENVLAKCVDSVLAQDFSDWELLLVDDGSPDGSGALCDDYAGQDDRVRVFHKTNGGVSSARNLGMAEAAGDYILFIDADDWIEPNACGTLLKALEGAGADSAGCAHWNIQPDGRKWSEPGALPAGVYDAPAIRKGIVDRLLGQRLGRPGEVLNGFIWRFLFSRSIIAENELRFAGAYLEDELFLMEYFCLAKRLAMVDAPLYYYLQNPASVTRNYLPDYMDTFRRFLAAKEAVAERYGLEGDDPQWRQSTCWAGLLIAIGNEFAPGNPASPAEKRRRVEGFTLEPGMAAAIRDLTPRGLGRNKQLVAALVRRRWFGLLSLLYAVKNRR
ncbi:MAG TPA: glycosyltransferase [Candidatus Intestinimonas stercorigallinarum]|nr:glycosyltransferase [Candidatus Intestinimonas stercorigallinarum]